MTDTPTQPPVEKTPAPQPSQAAPAGPFDALRREVDQLFEDFTPSLWRRSPFSPPRLFARGLHWPLAPAVDLVEQDGAYRLTAELPGIAPADVEVKVADGMLTIRGEKKEEKEEKKADYHMSERRYGEFQRSFSLPESVDAEHIEASFANGVLTVTLPKSDEAKANEKTIEVKTA